MNKCLYCHQILPLQEIDFHSTCSKKFFGRPIPPLLPYSLSQVRELAKRIVKRSITVTGIQEKLSLSFERTAKGNSHQRLTIVGLWGGFILKPPTKQYLDLPEIENTTMMMAQVAGIRTVPQSLIRFQSGELAFIAKRIDRNKKRKYHMEDMCQLTERLTEDKYKGSLEQVGKAILRWSANPGYDAITLVEIALFSFLSGNADMHLKNFSLLYRSDGTASLSPAYDLVATKLVMPKDTEETALSLNGKKQKLKLSDFAQLVQKLGIHEKAFENSLQRLKNILPGLIEVIENSFLPDKRKKELRMLLTERAKRLGFI